MIRSDRKAPPPQKTGPVTGINFIGMLSHRGGIGNAARMNVKQIRNLPIKSTWCDFPSEDQRDPRKIQWPKHNLNIFHFNPEAVNLHALMECKWFGYRNILYAAWETTKVPDAWIEWDKWIDTLWVPSEFTKQAFVTSGWKGRIDVIPHFVSHVHRKQSSAHEPDLKTLRVMVPFDSKSRIERKLPHLSIAATILACLEAEVEHDIILKTHDAKPRDINAIISKAVRLVEQSAPSWDRKFNIELCPKWLEEVELSVLMASCHAVISLNRGEGFGLSGIEAMASGIPIVWTNWGGSTQYMTEANCYPVAPIAITDVYGDDYFKTGQWAEPSLASAVDQIKILIDDIKSGRVDHVVEAGYAKAEEFNPIHVRQLMKQSIERILC